MSSINPELSNQETVVDVNEFVSVENPDSKRSKFGSFFKNPYPPGFSRKVTTFLYITYHLYLLCLKSLQNLHLITEESLYCLHV